MRTHPLVRDKPSWPSFRAMLEEREAAGPGGEEAARPALQTWRGASYTFAGVARSARSVAAFLAARGIAPGDRVIVTGENSPEWVIAYLGARLLGAVLVPLDNQLAPPVVRSFSAFAAARLAFVDGPRRADLEGARVPLDLVSIEPGSADFDRLFHGEPAPWSALPDPDPNGLGAILFTSGTTGDPKGVELTEANLLGNAQTLARLGIEFPDDSMAVVLPLHHAYAFTVGTLTPFAIGASVVFPRTLKGDQLRQCLAETGATILPAVPLLLERMAAGIEGAIAGRPLAARLLVRLLRSLSRRGRAIGIPIGRLLCRPIRRTIGPRLRLIISAGAALPAEVNDFFLDLGFRVVEGYGLTETSPAIAITPVDLPRPGSVGWALPGAEIAFGGAPRDDGSAEVLVRGPMVMRGYHKRPDLTAEAFEGDFLRTGDLGRCDGDGYLWITGRVKEVIVLPSGKNVYPEDVERHYLASRAIKEICVLQDPANPEALHALVVPDDSATRRAGEDVASRIRFDVEELSKTLPPYQRIAGFTLTAEQLPRTRLGKLRRGEVAKLVPALRRGALPRAELAAEELVLVDSEAGAVVMRVLEEIAGRAVHPGEHLELDLKLDSLRRLEALAKIETALGIEIDPEVVPEVSRPIDVIRAIGEARGTGEDRFSWSRLLREEPSPPLGEIVAIRPGIGARLVRAFGWCALQAYVRLRFGLSVAGAERLPAEPCIVAPNHVSIIDAPLMFIALPRRVRRSICFFAIRTQFQSAFRRSLIRPGRIILTDQLAGTRQSLQYGASALRLGLSLCIFPEGRRSATGEPEPGRPGTGLLAREFKVPVIPALIRGTEATLSRVPNPPRRGRFSVTFGPPIPPEAFLAIEDEDDLGKPWEAAIRALRASQQKPPDGPTGHAVVIF